MDLAHPPGAHGRAGRPDGAGDIFAVGCVCVRHGGGSEGRRGVYCYVNGLLSVSGGRGGRLASGPGFSKRKGKQSNLYRIRTSRCGVLSLCPGANATTPAVFCCVPFSHAVPISEVNLAFLVQIPVPSSQGGNASLWDSLSGFYTATRPEKPRPCSSPCSPFSKFSENARGTASGYL